MRDKAEVERIGGEFVTVRLIVNEEERRRLKVAAALSGCSVTDLVRRATWEKVAEVIAEKK